MAKRISLASVETNQRFFQLPKAFMEDDFYKPMTNDAKMAYAILKDRFQLSLKNKWVDDVGDVYLIYTNDELGEILNVGKNKIVRIKKELEDFGLLDQERIGVNKPNRLYLAEVVIHRAEASNDTEVSNTNYRKSQNETTGSFKNKLQEVSKWASNDTEYSETELSDTDSFVFDDDDLQIITDTLVVAQAHQEKTEDLQLAIRQAETYFGRQLTPVEQSQLGDLVKLYGFGSLDDAMRNTAGHGSTSMGYLQKAAWSSYQWELYLVDLAALGLAPTDINITSKDITLLGGWNTNTKNALIANGKFDVPGWGTNEYRDFAAM
jgi:Replication initiator protein A (RepA) N-terminus.